MKYIVYLTTNIINMKIYVGVHGTEDPNVFDGYLGNGVNIHSPSTIKYPKEPFEYAVKKYGFDAFIRKVLFVYDTMEEALYMEGLIVDEEFIARDDTYNITLGGGLPPRADKKTYQYDLEGNFIKEWNSRVEAARFYGCNDQTISGTVIYNAIIYKRKSYGFLWSDEKVDKLPTEEYKNKTQNIIINLYSDDRKYIKTFNSISECCRELYVCLEQVRRSLKFQYKLKGYYVSTELHTELPVQKNEQLTGDLHQYDLNGNYIRSYSSVKEASLITGLNLIKINDYIKGKGYYKGFQWRRGERLESIPAYENKSLARKVGQYTMDDELVKIFDTVREARKEFPNVGKVLAGIANHCHHFKFKYIES